MTLLDCLLLRFSPKLPLKKIYFYLTLLSPPCCLIRINLPLTRPCRHITFTSLEIWQSEDILQPPAPSLYFSTSYTFTNNISVSSDVTWSDSHWFFRLIRWNFNLFPFEFIYSDCTIRSGLVSHSQNYSTLWLYIYIYCWYYGIKWIFTVLDMYEIIPILYKSRPM